jgi:hypothetical protein
MSNQYAQLVEKINRIVRDRGDVELMVLLDRIADKETEVEQAAALGEVVKILNQSKKPQGGSHGESGSAANASRATKESGSGANSETSQQGDRETSSS